MVPTVVRLFRLRMIWLLLCVGCAPSVAAPVATLSIAPPADTPVMAQAPDTPKPPSFDDLKKTLAEKQKALNTAQALVDADNAGIQFDKDLVAAATAHFQAVQDAYPKTNVLILGGNGSQTSDQTFDGTSAAYNNVYQAASDRLKAATDQLAKDQQDAKILQHIQSLENAKSDVANAQIDVDLEAAKPKQPESTPADPEVFENVVLYYDDDVAHLMKILNPNSILTKLDGTGPDYAGDATKQFETLVADENAVTASRQKLTNARTDLTQKQAALADANSKLTAAQSAQSAAQSVQTVTTGQQAITIQRLQDQQSLQQATVDNDASRVTAATALVSSDTTDVSAAQTTGAVSAAKAKLKEDQDTLDVVTKQQQADMERLTFLKAASTNATNDSATQKTIVSQAVTDAQSAVNSAQTDVSNAQTAADAAQKTANDTGAGLQMDRSAAYLQTVVENKAFAAARDNASYWYSPRQNAADASADPLLSVDLYGFPDAKTIFIRGPQSHVQQVKAIIASIDRPEAQAFMTLWTVEISSKGNKEGTESTAEALSTLRDKMNVTSGLLEASTHILERGVSYAEEWVMRQLSKTVYGDPGKYTKYTEFEKEKLAFYDDDFLKKMGIKQDPTSADYPANKILLDYVPNPDLTTTPAAALIVLALAQDECEREGTRYILRSLGRNDYYGLEQLSRPTPSLYEDPKKPKPQTINVQRYFDEKYSESTPKPLRIAEQNYLDSHGLSWPGEASSTANKPCTDPDIGDHFSRLQWWLGRFPKTEKEKNGPGTDEPGVGAYNLRKELIQYLRSSAQDHLEGDIVKTFCNYADLLQQQNDLSNTITEATALQQKLMPSESATTPSTIHDLMPALQSQLASQKSYQNVLDAKRQKPATDQSKLKKLQAANDENLTLLSQRINLLSGFDNAYAQSPLLREPVTDTKTRLTSLISGWSQLEGDVQHDLSVAEITVLLPKCTPTKSEIQNIITESVALKCKAPDLHSQDLSREGALNEALKATMTAFNEDLQDEYVTPMFEIVRQQMNSSGVSVGVFQRTSVQASNRFVARVSPNAAADLEVSNEQNSLADLTNLLKIVGTVADPVAGLAGAGVASLAKSAAGGAAGSLSLPAFFGAGHGKPGSAAGGGTLDQASRVVESLDRLPSRTTPPGIYGVTTGNTFQITPVVDPTGQAMHFIFDHVLSTPITEPDGTTNTQLPRIEHHSINTEVQLSNNELRTISQFDSNVRIGMTPRRLGGIPGLRDIFPQVPILGYFSRISGEAPEVQQSLVLAQATMIPTIHDVIGLLTEQDH